VPVLNAVIALGIIAIPMLKIIQILTIKPMSNLDDGHDEIIGQRVSRPSLSSYGDLIERQFDMIVNGLQIEYAGKANALINLCSDARFIRAKKLLYESLPKEKADDLLHTIFNQ
jgi:hypothetical protein